jgi:hypothetical protein
MFDTFGKRCGTADLAAWNVPKGKHLFFEIRMTYKSGRFVL